MKIVVSTLFQVMHFPHDGSIVTIDQLSFLSLDRCMTADHSTSLNVPYIKVVSPSLQVNYVALSPMNSISNENEALIVCSYSLDLVSTIDMITPLIGKLEHDLPLVDQSESHDMYSF
jgi:hypothetical protein